MKIVVTITKEEILKAERAARRAADIEFGAYPCRGIVHRQEEREYNRSSCRGRKARDIIEEGLDEYYASSEEDE